MIGYATDFQLEKMFTRFYPEGGEEGGKKFCAQVRQHNKPVTAAQIDHHIYMYINFPGGQVYFYLNFLFWPQLQYNNK